MRLATAAAATALAVAVQMRFLWAAEAAVPAGFFLAQLAAVACVQLAAALLLAGWRKERPWAAAVFSVPLALAWATPAWSAAGARGVAAVALSTLAVVALFVAPRRGRGAPLPAAVLGAAAAAEVARANAESVTGEIGSAALLGMLAATGAALVLALLAARLPAPLSRPSPRQALAWTLLGALVALWPARFAVPDLPSPPAHVSAAPHPAPPVILIVLDTLRADHLRAYGYERDTMPRLERFAREHGVMARRAIANGPWSLPTHASLLTGRYPPDHGAMGVSVADPDPPRVGHPIAARVPTLAELLSDAGYWSVGIASNFAVTTAHFGFARGFDFYQAEPDPSSGARARSAWRLDKLRSTPAAPLLAALDALPPFSWSEYFLGVDYRRARSITDQALAVVAAAGERPFFLFLNYFDPHEPTQPPWACVDLYPGRRSARGFAGPTAAVRAAVLEGRAPLSPADRAHMNALYDAELACLDRELDRLLTALEEHPRFDDMLIVVTADHGEAMGEHDTLGHGSSLYDEQIRVPFFAKPRRGSPGAPPPGSQIEEPIMSVDVFATVLEHAGIEAPEGMDGVAWARGRRRVFAWSNPPGRERRDNPRFDRELRSVEEGGLKRIASSAGADELFDLGRDPGETRDLAASASGGERLASVLPDRAPVGAARDSERALDAATEARLRALGYLSD